MATLEQLEVGDLVAILAYNKAVSRDTVERLTPTQGVLRSGKKFRLKDGGILRESGTVAAMTEELSIQLLERERNKLACDRLNKAQSSIRRLHDEMAKSYYNGFTAEELEVIANEMKGAIVSRESRIEKRQTSIDGLRNLSGI